MDESEPSPRTTCRTGTQAAHAGREVGTGAWEWDGTRSTVANAAYPSREWGRRIRRGGSTPGHTAACDFGCSLRSEGQRCERTLFHRDAVKPGSGIELGRAIRL